MPAITTGRILIGGVLLVALAAQAQEQGPTYSIADMGTLGGLTTQGLAINGLGQVTGSSATGNNFGRHAFIYGAGLMTDLGTLEGDGNSVGLGINDAGQVTGQSSGAIPGLGARGFFYSNGAMTGFGPMGGGPASAGNGINSAGVVAGFSATETYTHAVTYSSGVVNDIGGFGTYNSLAYGINDAGHVVGAYDTATSNCCVQRAFLYVDGTVTDLGTFGGTISEARAINAEGVVTGLAYVTGNNDYHAFTYRDGTLIDLGVLGGQGGSSIGLGINAAGDVVGWSSGASGGQRAFLYSNGEMVDLNTLIAGTPLATYVTLQEATAINDSGWIVANGVDSRIQLTRGYLLMPFSEISVTPSSLSFGNQRVSVSSEAKIMMIKSVGPAPLRISSIEVDGVNRGDFVAVDNCPRGNLAVGMDCTVSIRFTPAASGDRTASLRIVSTSGSSPSLLALVGTGTAPIATPTPTPTAAPSGGGGGVLPLGLLCTLLAGLITRAVGVRVSAQRPL